MSKLWIIEARNADGSLKLDGPQPHEFFGMGAIHGIDDNAMARPIFRKIPDASLQGDRISTWPSLINPHWKARVKTW
jgi:hypothetical protein